MGRCADQHTRLLHLQSAGAFALARVPVDPLSPIASRGFPMPVTVTLSGVLRAAAEGNETVELEAATISELLANLIRRYPEMASHMDAGIAVSIDGQIYRDNWGTPIPPGAEIFLLPRIAGG